MGPIAMFSLHLTDMKIRRNGVLVSLVLPGNLSLGGANEVCQAKGDSTAVRLLSFIQATTSSPHISIGNMVGSAQSVLDYHRECWRWAYKPPSIMQLSDG